MAKILFIGDVVGKPGRKVLRQVLPQWKEKYQPDVTIVNVENLAHGKGVTPSTLAEIDDLEIDCFTSGNHVFKKGDLSADCFEKYPKLIRPANYLSLFPSPREGRGGEGLPVPGHGYYRFAKMPINRHATEQENVARPFMGNQEQQFLIINLNGQVFMEKQFDGAIANPFLTIDQLLLDQAQKGDIIIVDFHAEATSEKAAMGLYLDGRVTAVFGTHTHVPTADARVLSAGAAYVTDVGMTGARDSVLGVKKENALKKFLNAEEKFKYEVEEEGVMQVNGALVEVDENQKAVKIEKLYKEINN